MVPLLHDNFYHIYNRGNNHENLFRSEDNYIYFPEQYIKHVSTIAETYTWVLMRNHFHFLVRIKSIEEINRDATPDRVSNPVRGNMPHPVRGNMSNPVRGYIPNPSGDNERRQIINWFNDIENFKAMHQMKVDTELLSEILLE